MNKETILQLIEILKHTDYYDLQQKIIQMIEDVARIEERVVQHSIVESSRDLLTAINENIEHYYSSMNGEKFPFIKQQYIACEMDELNTLLKEVE